LRFILALSQVIWNFDCVKPATKRMGILIGEQSAASA
jgi:hypothetical protein